MKYLLLIQRFVVLQILFLGLGSFFTFAATVTLSSNNPAVAAAGVNPGATKVPIYRFQLVKSGGGGSDVTGLNFTTNAGYVASDIVRFQLWVNTSDDLSTASQISSNLIPSGPGTQTFAAFTLTVATHYLWITMDISATATTANTISIAALTTANYTAGTKAGSASAGGIQTFNPLSPTLSASGSATVDAPFDITYTDNATWRGAITSITVGGSTLAGGAYSVTAGKITFTPSADPLLQSSELKSIVVIATGYSNGTVSQSIGAGAPSKLAISAQPTIATSSGGVFSTQPIILIQDQYSNTTTSTASVTASVGAGAWTIGGTTNINATSGTATYTNVTATYATAITGATITFTSTGLTSVTTTPINFYLGTVYYLKTANLTAAQTASSWNTGGSGGGGTDAANFTTASTIFIISSTQSASCGGALAIGAGVTLVNEGTLNMQTYQLTGSGVIVNNGTFKTENTTNPPVPNGNTWGGTVQYARAAGAQTLAFGVYENLILSNTGGSVTANGDVTVNGTLTTTTGGILAMSTFALAATIVVANASVTTSNTSSTPLPSGKTWGANVTYAANGQTVMPGTYNNLLLTLGSGASNTAGGNIVVNGTITIGSGHTFNMSTYQLSGSGTFTNNGTLRTACTANPPLPTGKSWGGTVYYDNASGYFSAGTYQTLIFSDAKNGLLTVGGNISINELTLPADGVLDFGTNQVTTLNTVTYMIGKLRTANTTTTPMPYKTWAAGTIEYYGSQNQYINKLVSFYNVIISNTAGVIVTKETCSNTGVLTVNPGGILALQISDGQSTSYWDCKGSVVNNGSITTTYDANQCRFRLVGTGTRSVSGNGTFGTTQVFASTAVIGGSINVVGWLWAHNSTLTIGNESSGSITVTADKVFVTSSGTISTLNIGNFDAQHTIITKNLSTGIDGSSSINLYLSPTKVCNVIINLTDAVDERILTGTSHNFNNLTIHNAFATEREINAFERLTSVHTIYGNLTISSNVNLRIDTRDLNVRGNIINNGKIGATTGIVKLQNTVSNTLPHSISGSGYFNHVQLDDILGAQLESNIAIVGNLTLTSGIFNTNTFTIDIGTLGTLIEATPNILAPTSYILGKVKSTRNLMQNVNNTFGGIGVEILEANFTNNTTVIIRETGISPFSGSATRKFSISPTTKEALNATLVFRYFDHEILGVEANHKLYRYVTEWNVQPSSVIDAANNKLTLTNIPAFSDWTASDEMLLPIELIEFTAKKQHYGVLLEWETASETNNDFFTLYRSSNGVDFIPITIIQGANTTSFNSNYSYFDNSIYSGITYYKLSQTDFDGSVSFFDIITSREDSQNFELISLKNTNSLCGLSILFPNDEKNTVRIVSMIGVVEYEAVFYNTSFEFIELQLTPGVYSIINIDNASINKQLFIVK